MGCGVLLAAGVLLDVGSGVRVSVGVAVGVFVSVGVKVAVGVGVGVTHIDSKQYVPENVAHELGITDGEADNESSYDAWQLLKLIALILKANGRPEVLVQVPSPLIIPLLVKV